MQITKDQLKIKWDIAQKVAYLRGVERLFTDLREEAEPFWFRPEFFKLDWLKAYTEVLQKSNAEGFKLHLDWMNGDLSLVKKVNEKVDLEVDMDRFNKGENCIVIVRSTDITPNAPGWGHLGEIEIVYAGDNLDIAASYLG